MARRAVERYTLGVFEWRSFQRMPQKSVDTNYMCGKEGGQLNAQCGKGERRKLVEKKIHGRIFTVKAKVFTMLQVYVKTIVTS